MLDASNLHVCSVMDIGSGGRCSKTVSLTPDCAELDNSTPHLSSGRVPHEAATMLGPMTLSARNRLEGKITELQLGGVMAHVVLQVGNNVIESVITRRSAVEMGLKVGDTVSAVIKSTEIMLEKQ
ncbi:MAG TPA: TOBE domain-containing protein [Methylomirabilota bacterium]|nr:TOBE domain-containing protein [Methylomirabilota bacterium]